MKEWFRNMGYRMNAWMQGRNGNDELCRFMTGAAMVCFILSFIPHMSFCYALALVLLFWSIFRQFSKNLYKRGRERDFYLGIRDKVVKKFRLLINRWKFRKTHRYYKCPNCKQVVRVRKPPKGKTIMITCTSCNRTFTQRT